MRKSERNSCGYLRGANDNSPLPTKYQEYDLERVLSSLIEKGVADDQNFPVLRQYSAEGWEVSFAGAEHVSFAMGDIDYGDIHRELSEKRSYNAKLIDGGLLQLMYRFNGDQLVKHPACLLSIAKPSPLSR